MFNEYFYFLVNQVLGFCGEQKNQRAELLKFPVPQGRHKSWWYKSLFDSKLDLLLGRSSTQQGWWHLNAWSKVMETPSAPGLPQLVAEAWEMFREDCGVRSWGRSYFIYPSSPEAFQYFNHKYCWLSLWYAMLQEYIIMRPDLTSMV